MAIQMRRGAYEDFDSSKMVAGEIAVVQSGDPASDSGRTVYVCFEPGVVKRFTTYEDFENEMQNATEEIQESFTEAVQEAISEATSATSAANTATAAANMAADAAQEAAEAASAYVLGDISNNTVTFAETDTREEIKSGESTATLFGKIKKWLSDLHAVAFSGSYEDLKNTPDVLEKTGDSAENTTTFTSGDASSASSWTNVSTIASGETHASLFNKLSTMVKNVRYLWSLIGSTDISSVGDGTLTGAVSSLNSGKANIEADTKDFLTTSNFDLMPDGTTGTILSRLGMCYISSSEEASTYHAPALGYALAFGKSTKRYAILFISRTNGNIYTRTDFTEWINIS